MTVKDLYEWAEKNNCLNLKLAKFSNSEAKDIVSVDVVMVNGYALTQRELDDSKRVVLV